MFTVLAVIQFLGACCDDSIGFSCHDNRRCRNGKGILVPLGSKVGEHVNEIRMCWFLEGSSVDPAGLVVAATTSAEVSWKVLGSLDTWFLYHWETGEVFDLSNGHSTVSLKPAPGGSIHLAC